jgi:urease accessory protein
VPTIPELMRVLQFGDSVLPVGAFSFSNGLESAIQLGIVRDPATLEQYVDSALHQAATSDGIAVLAAFRAARDDDLDRVVAADLAVYNRKLNEEMRTMTVRMGRKLAELAERVLGPSACSSWLSAIRGGDAPGCFPVGQAIVFSSLGLSEQDAFAVHQYGLASMMVAASLRLMRIHYLDAQAILFRVNSGAEAHYGRIASASIDDMAAFAPVMDIVASSHVKATVRMFMN